MLAIALNMFPFDLHCPSSQYMLCCTYRYASTKSNIYTRSRHLILYSAWQLNHIYKVCQVRYTWRFIEYTRSLVNVFCHVFINKINHHDRLYIPTDEINKHISFVIWICDILASFPVYTSMHVLNGTTTIENQELSWLMPTWLSQLGCCNMCNILQWCDHGIWNHWQLVCLFTSLFRLTSKKASYLFITGQ